MPLEIISKIKPKNGADFSVADAADIETADGRRVEDVLQELVDILAGPGSDYAGKYLAVGPNGMFTFVDPPAEGVIAASLSCNFKNGQRGSACGDLTLQTMGAAEQDIYRVYWADAKGILSGYAPIFEYAGAGIKTYTFTPTNAIPDGATKILAIKDGQPAAFCTIPTAKRLTAQKSYSFGLMSDPHIDGDGDDTSESITDYKRAVEFYDANGVVFDIVSGDMTYDGRSSDLTAYAECRAHTSVPVYHCRGNHDMVSEEKYKQYIDPKGFYYDVLQGDDVYLFIGVGSTSKNIPGEQNQWLSDKLNEYYGAKRVIIVEHLYVDPVGDANNLDKNDGQKDATFLATLAAHPDVILITGHSHLQFELQSVAETANSAYATDVMCNRVHVPSLARPKDPYTVDLHKGSQGYLVDVYPDYTVFRGRDFASGKYLPMAQYIFYKPKGYKKLNDITYFVQGTVAAYDGSFANSASSYRSGWIILDGNVEKKLKFIGTAEDIRVVYYDNNQEFLSADTSMEDKVKEAGEIQALTPPSQAAYMVIKTAGVSYANITFNGGDGMAAEQGFEYMAVITSFVNGSLNLSTGAFESSQSSWRTDFISLSDVAAKKLYFSGTVIALEICFYDTHKGFAGAQDESAKTFVLGDMLSLSIPVNASFLVLKARGDYAGIQFNGARENSMV